MRGHCTDCNFIARLADVTETTDTAEVHQHGRLREAQLHCWKKAVAAGKDLGVIMSGEKIQGVLKRVGRFVVEVCRDHARLLAAFFGGTSAAAAMAGTARAACMAFHTRSGLSGISMWRTPNGDSASQTAFTMHGVEASVPASPTPFTPMGFTGDGVTVCSSVKSGKKCAFGTA